MDPFLDLKFNDLKRQATSVDMNSHFNPKWSDIIKFERDPQDDTCIVECWNFDE